ncbi:MAG: hypothetical protein JXX29_10785 [Deltaproteobacteria bacterium]|nr:hypothetical protein [Deltaproteobacteria bacterium]MBN2672154.1 hypothetical protein [Deltaproteobacteria bacterium]
MRVLIVLPGCKEDKKADFSSSECKSHLDSMSLLPWVVADQYPGLQCIAYQSTPDGAIAFNIINYTGNCSGVAGDITSVSKNDIEILLRPPDCDELARCSCPFDLEFSVTDMSVDADVEITLQSYSCANDVVNCSSIAILPLGSTSTGMACRYGGGSELGTSLHDECSSNPEDNNNCGEGLVCAAETISDADTGSAENERCLTPCISDADCPAPGALYCANDHLCRIATELISCTE